MEIRGKWDDGSHSARVNAPFASSEFFELQNSTLTVMPKFVPRQRKQKARGQQKQNGYNGSQDTNAVELLPASKDERAERRQQMYQDLRAQQPQSKISAKKQKRLDKYINKKLRKEENQELVNRLAEQDVDTSLLRSSKNLGRTHETKREALSRALKERDAGMDVEKNNALLIEQREVQGEVESSSDDEEDDAGDQASRKTNTAEKPLVVEKTEQPTPTELHGSAFGSGLKRPLDVDVEGKPVIKMRRRTKYTPAVTEIQSDEEWDGFSENNSYNISTGGESEENYLAELDGHTGSASEDTESETSVSEDDPSNDNDAKVARNERSSAFKAWATKQRNDAIGFQPSLAIDTAPSTNSKPVNFTPRPIESDPLPPELATKTATDGIRQAYSVQVQRTPEIQEARIALPVVAEEQKIMESIHNNDVVVIWGATGSGKTTQIPQFLFEAGYGDANSPTPGMIGVTQPRRVAAVSMSTRVGDELCEAKDRVSYQIRFDSSVSNRTAVKFMTDGVLLREIANDFALTKYSAIVIDEAHERSVNTDILIGMMSRIVDLRSTIAREDSSKKPLKLIIMSATLRISDFTENQNLFRNGPPPVVQAEGRQHPVTIHFSRNTHRDYVTEAFKKISRGHKKLPSGGMLVFLTGLNEITDLSGRLRQKFASSTENFAKGPEVRVSTADASVEAEDLELGESKGTNLDDDASDEEIDPMGVDNEEDDHEFDIGEMPEDIQRIHVLPLYSQLPTNQQLRVFQPPPEGSRLIVLATNVAETSLTIPGIRYVFDCGRSKERKYDEATGVQSFEVGWISKASANQRTGRAGRTGPGHCYRLYSSAVYERDFEEHAAPELLRTPIEGIVLQLKSMDLQHVVNFPFPTPPDRQSLVKAEKLLAYLGAISTEGKVTHGGRELSLYPLSPRFSRMLVLGQSYNLTAYAIALVAALATPELFVPQNQLALAQGSAAKPSFNHDSDNENDQSANIEIGNKDLLVHEERRKAYNTAHATLSKQSPTSDAMKLLSALCAYAYTNSDSRAKLCESMFLRPKALQEASQLRQQLHNIVTANKPALGLGKFGEKLAQPKSNEVEMLKQIVAAGFVDQVAVRADLSSEGYDGRKPARASDVPYLTLFPSHEGKISHEDDENQKYVYVHPASVLAHRSVKALPQYVVYATLQRSSPSIIGKVARVRMHPLTDVSGRQLITLAKRTPLLEWGKPVGKVDALGRVEGYERRECTLIPSLIGQKGGLGWPLPGTRVIQRKEGTRGWVVEKVLS
ncbi:MAG: putative ATP-dependent RNA helicase DHR1 [Bogoriella megaspora]|nr:MAG: putative ATP-dependent RNA helicase DHR1 [Bogoriella megaspora]